MNKIDVKTRISVQSSGFSNRHDYRWQSVTDNQYPDEPYRDIPGVRQIQLNSFSLVISRSTDGLFLLISGLDSGRKDIRHRQIRNTVLWSIPNPNDRDEAIYRHIAALALRDRSNGSAKLDRYIQQAIVADKDNDYGYTVNTERLEPETILQNIFDRDYLGRLDRAESITIPSSLSKNFDEIGEALEKYRLPTSNKHLIVINDGKTQDTVEAGRLYLSLGDISIEPSIADLQQDEVSPKNSINFFDKLKDLIPKILLPLIVVIPIIALSLNIINSNQKIPTPRIDNLKTETTFKDNKHDKFKYILTGHYNSPNIESVELIDRQQKPIASGIVDNSNNHSWKIEYSSRSRLDFDRTLSVQGYRDGKPVGEPVEIPPV